MAKPFQWRFRSTSDSLGSSATVPFLCKVKRSRFHKGHGLEKSKMGGKNQRQGPQDCYSRFLEGSKGRAALDKGPKAHWHTFARVGNVVFTSPFLQHVRTKFWFHRVSKARKEEFPEVCKAGSCRFLFHRSAFPRHRIMNFQRKSQRTYLTLCDKIRFWHMCWHILRQTLTYCWHVLLYDIAWHILEQFLYVLHGYFEISSDIFSDALSLSVSCSYMGVSLNRDIQKWMLYKSL